jgi:uncharacterized membrane protein YciS (DUF1049 family)
MKHFIKQLIGPTILIIAISTMYIMSINPNEPTNRADIAFFLMTLLAAIYAILACRWYIGGLMTYKMMKEQERAASKIIEKLVKAHPKEKRGTVIEKLVIDQISETVTELQKIIEKHES